MDIMEILLLIILNGLAVGLFLYSKLLPYKTQLAPQNAKVFNFFSRIFEPVLKFMRKIFSPTQVGRGLAVDMAQIWLFMILLLLIQLVR
jgi:hypothetical protein